MPKYLVLAVVISLFFVPFFACASSTQEKKNPGKVDNDFWDTTPQGNQLVFHGVSNQFHENLEKGIRCAKEDAARRVALFLGVRAESTLAVSNNGGGIWDETHFQEKKLYFDENYTSLVEDLEFDKNTDVRIIDKAVFVRVRYTPASPFRFDHRYTAWKEKKPDWIGNPPQVSGFVVGVGHANAHSDLKDAVIVSYENALLGIAAAIYSKEQGGSHIGSTSQAEADTVGFYVLETWIDPANRNVYTLAIAQEKK